MSNFTGKHILLVEDDAFLANALKIRLEENGMVFVVAPDGEKAIEALTTKSPDLVILDLMMPHKDGFAVLKEMQKNQDWKLIPVVVVSNLGQQTDIDRALKLGAREFLVKSDVSTADILQTIGKYLG